MGGGTPAPLIDELPRQRKAALTIVCNDTARPGVGVGELIDAAAARAGARAALARPGLLPDHECAVVCTLIDRLKGVGPGTVEPAPHALAGATCETS